MKVIKYKCGCLQSKEYPYYKRIRQCPKFHTVGFTHLIVGKVELTELEKAIYEID